MSPEIISSLIGLIGILLGAIPTYVFMRKKGLAEIDKIKAETEKIKAESEQIRKSLSAEVKQTSTEVLKLIADQCCIRFSESFHTEQKNSFDIEGTLANRPPSDYEIWVFILEGKGKDLIYWAQDSAAVRKNSWFSKVKYVGNGNHKLSVCLVGKNGQALIKLYQLAGEKINSLDPQSAWVPIKVLTDDIIECETTAINIR